MKETPTKLGLCSDCWNSQDDFENCPMMVEPDYVVTECTDFEYWEEES